MKAKQEYVEGTEAFTRFQGAMRKVLTVSHSEIQRRIEAARKASAANPVRRGPKRKTKPSV
jgi:hypothetical protein